MRKIQIASITDKENIRKYFYEYLVELSEFDPNVKFDNTSTPIYNWFDCYWTDKERYPLLLSINNKFAGLALLREVGTKQYEIAEFFVLPEYRKDNNAIEFATLVTNLFDGQFEFSTRIENKRAIKFWDKFAQRFNGSNTFVEDNYKNWNIKTNELTQFDNLIQCEVADINTL